MPATRVISRSCPRCLQLPALPFLYHTKTIQAYSCLETPQRQHKSQTPCRLFSTPGHALAKQDEAIPFESSKSSSPEDEEHILFPHHAPAKASEKSRHRSRRPRDSTITASEQAIFDRIFADIASSKQRASEQTLDEESEIAEESFGDLESIFNKTLENLQARTQRHEERKANRRRRSYTPIIADDIPTLNSYSTELRDRAGWDKPGVIGSENISDLATAHKQHRSKIERMVDSAQTDTEIWAVLTKEVFPLVEELNARIEDVRKAKKRGPKVFKQIQSEKLDKQAERRARDAAKLRDQNTPASLPPTVLLSILQTEYPQYLTLVSRTLREHFPSSTYALNILPAVRRLGPISYVLGASTALYNETLLLLWNQESDLHGMADLLDEMGKQGVESNEVTTKFLRGVKQVRTSELLGANGAWRSMWWRMASVEEGWQRVAAGLERCAREVSLMEEEERRMEEREMEEWDSKGEGS